MLVVDLNRQEIQSVDAQSQEPRGKNLSLTHSIFRIDEIFIGSERMAAGETSMPCSVKGITPSYALAIRGPANQMLWLFFTGVTGQWRTFSNAEPVKLLLEATSHAKP